MSDAAPYCVLALGLAAIARGVFMLRTGRKR